MKKHLFAAFLCGLLLTAGLRTTEAVYLPEEEAALLDRPDTASIPVYVSVFCKEDETLEATIKVVAENRLQSISGIRLAESLDDASVILSFAGQRKSLPGEPLQEVVAYSFACGTAELEFVGDELVSLPRYIYHECVLASKHDLSSHIAASIQYADSSFIDALKRYSALTPEPDAPDAPEKVQSPDRTPEPLPAPVSHDRL